MPIMFIAIQLIISDACTILEGEN